MNHNTCPFCGQAMSEENEPVISNTCRNANCRAFLITLCPETWQTMTEERLQSYINGRTFAPKAEEYGKVITPRPDDAQTVLFTVEQIGARQFVIVTGLEKERTHSVRNDADIQHYFEMYQSQGYKVVRS